MAAAKPATKTQVAKYLTKMLEEVMSQGDRAALRRTIQKVKGER